MSTRNRTLTSWIDKGTPVKANDERRGVVVAMFGTRQFCTVRWDDTGCTTTEPVNGLTRA